MHLSQASTFPAAYGSHVFSLKKCLFFVVVDKCCITPFMTNLSDKCLIAYLAPCSPTIVNTYILIYTFLTKLFMLFKLFLYQSKSNAAVMN